MSEQYRPVKGDRVRVVLEGEVTDDDTSAGFTVEHEVPFFYDDPGLISVEKIEPPVETFRPGDVVRRKGAKLQHLITDDGWVAVGRGWTFPGTHMAGPRTFTSESYEKVSLG